MEKQKKKEFEEACKAYLFPLSIIDLRAYGRYLGLPAPTKLTKAKLIYEIIQVLCGEKTVARTNKGAPIKNNHYEDKIPLEINKIRARIFAEERERGNKDKNTEIKESVTPLQLSITIENLTKEQRQLLQQLLNSL